MFVALLILPLCASPALPQEALATAWLQSLGGDHPSAEKIVAEFGQDGAKGLLSLERSLGARLSHPTWQRTFDDLPHQAAQLIETEPSPELRTFGMLAGQRHGEWGCLNSLVRLSRLPSTSTVAAQEKTGAAFADALAAVFLRDPRALPKLRVNTVPRMHLPHLADRLGRLADPRALTILVQLMDGESGPEQAALSAIARLARTVTLVPEDAELRRVRYRVEHPEEGLRMLACQALGLLQDEHGVRLLQSRLTDPSSSVRTAAHTALRRITGLRLHQGPRAWLSWIRTQEDWWNNRSNLVLSALPTAQGAECASLLREIAGARLHRRALTAELLALLDNSHVDSISLLLAAIVALDSPQAMPAISLLLSHPDHEVRKAATLALAALRGSKSPPKTPSEAS
jgi:hypothetical protein